MERSEERSARAQVFRVALSSTTIRLWISNALMSAGSVILREITSPLVDAVFPLTA